MTCDAYDVVVVPFPFADRPVTKRRPALVLSQRTFNASGRAVMAMITSTGHRSWPGDTLLKDQSPAGLPAASVVRLKLFTLDDRLILRKAGALSITDRKRVASQLRKHLATH